MFRRGKVLVSSVIYSPGLKAEVPVDRDRKIFTFSSFHPEQLCKFQPNIIRRMEFKVL